MASHVNLFGESETIKVNRKRAISTSIVTKHSGDYKRAVSIEDKFFIVPSFSLHTDELYVYGRKEWIAEPTIKAQSSLNNLYDNTTHNKLSSQATKKAKRAIKYLLLQASDKKVYNPKFRTTFNFTVNFITLTLAASQIHTHQVIKKELLNQFLIEAKKKWGLTNYVWRAEKQKNGNIHFHILSDKFIPWSELRQTWNRIQSKLGYTQRYQALHHKREPNSTDIHSLREVKNVYKYVTKYMTKQSRLTKSVVNRSESLIKEKKDKTSPSVTIGAKKFLGSLNSIGREWACSRSLSNIKGVRDDYEGEYTAELEKLRKSNLTKEVVKDYVSMYYFKKETITAEDFPKLHSLLKAYIGLIFKDPEKMQIDTTGSVFRVPVNDKF